MMKDAKKILKNVNFLKDEAVVMLGAEATEEVWSKAKPMLQKMLDEHEDIPKGVAAHTDKMIFPSAAVYLALKEIAPEKAYDIMKEAMKKRATAKGDSLARMAKVPGFNKFFVGKWDSVSRKLFGETAGFKNVFYPCPKGKFKMDITQCPYNKYLTEVGCPEINVLFCDNDVYAYGNIPGIKFTRTKTIGVGDELCDFNLELE